MGMESRLWLPTPIPTPTTSAPLPKAKVTGSGTLTSEPSTLYIPCASPKTTAKPRSSTLRRLTFTRKCVKVVPLPKVFSSKLSSSSFPSSTAPNANVVKRDATGERPRGDSCSSVSSRDHPLPAEPPPPYQLRVANPAPASGYDDHDYDYDHNIHGRGAAAAAKSSSSRFTAASVEAVRAPDSPVPTFPSPKLSTESVFGGSTSTRSLASVSDLESAAPANTNGTTGTTIAKPRPRNVFTLRNSAARGAGPALRRKDTIGFARRVTLSSGLGLSRRET